nr:GNAT family N-acetyltransferase [Candidatus Cloacimonadota bacterium]
LLVIEKESGKPIGECKLGLPNEEGVAHTDVKLVPAFWGKGFGVEIKQGLVDYLFTHTNCKAIQASPNKSNIASQKMQEKVGAKRIREGVYNFPESMQPYTKPVEYYLYRIDRTDWEKR